MNVCVKSPGSGGELIQGTLGGEPFLVTCPIDLYAVAGGASTMQLDMRSKAYRAYNRTLEYLGMHSTAITGIALSSELPTGKGMASSSADIAAVVQLTAFFGGQSLSADEIAAIAVEIEPTDGVFYEGIVRMNHLNGIVYDTWTEIPPLVLALFDIGGFVDTLSFNQRQDLAELNCAKEPIVAEALNLLRQGFSEQDISLIGKAATMSAFANQEILYKPQLSLIYETASMYGAVGINIAHSGTIVGALFAPEQAAVISALRERLCCLVPDIEYLYTVNLISGGLRKDVIGDAHI